MDPLLMGKTPARPYPLSVCHKTKSSADNRKPQYSSTSWQNTTVLQFDKLSLERMELSLVGRVVLLGQDE